MIYSKISRIYTWIFSSSELDNFNFGEHQKQIFILMQICVYFNFIPFKFNYYIYCSLESKIYSILNNIFFTITKHASLVRQINDKNSI